MEREQLNFYLQQAEPAKVQQLSATIENTATVRVRVMRQPTSQTLLVPVRDPINTGNFIAGEVLVTSCVVQVDGVNGWAMVMDDNQELARALAILDGAWAAGVSSDAIHNLAMEGKEKYTMDNRAVNARVNSTRVAFDLL